MGVVQSRLFPWTKADASAFCDKINAKSVLKIKQKTKNDNEIFALSGHVASSNGLEKENPGDHDLKGDRHFWAGGSGEGLY